MMIKNKPTLAHHRLRPSSSNQSSRSPRRTGSGSTKDSRSPFTKRKFVNPISLSKFAPPLIGEDDCGPSPISQASQPRRSLTWFQEEPEEEDATETETRQADLSALMLSRRPSNEGLFEMNQRAEQMQQAKFQYSQQLEEQEPSWSTDDIFPIRSASQPAASSFSPDARSKQRNESIESIKHCSETAMKLSYDELVRARTIGQKAKSRIMEETAEEMHESNNDFEAWGNRSLDSMVSESSQSTFSRSKSWTNLLQSRASAGNMNMNAKLAGKSPRSEETSQANGKRGSFNLIPTKNSNESWQLFFFKSVGGMMNVCLDPINKGQDRMLTLTEEEKQQTTVQVEDFINNKLHDVQEQMRTYGMLTELGVSKVICENGGTTLTLYPLAYVIDLKKKRKQLRQQRRLRRKRKQYLEEALLATNEMDFDIKSNHNPTQASMEEKEDCMQHIPDKSDFPPPIGEEHDLLLNHKEETHGVLHPIEETAQDSSSSCNVEDEEKDLHALKLAYDPSKQPPPEVIEPVDDALDSSLAAIEKHQEIFARSILNERKKPKQLHKKVSREEILLARKLKAIQNHMRSFRLLTELGIARVIGEVEKAAANAQERSYTL